MHAAVVAVEEAGAGQRPAAGAHRAEAAAEARLGLQEGHMFTADTALDADAAADDHRIQRRRIGHAGVRGDLQAVAGPHLATIQAQGVPAVQLAPGEVVGHAQGFDCRSEGNQGEVIQQQEADGLRSPGLQGNAGVERIHGQYPHARSRAPWGWGDFLLFL
ncbi:hypothetical protein D3C76_1097330 [compost metagenome]